MADVSEELLRQLLAQRPTPRASGARAFGMTMLGVVALFAAWWAVANVSIDLPVTIAPMGTAVVSTPTRVVLPTRAPRQAPVVQVQAQPTSTPVPTSGLLCDGDKFQVDATGAVWCENAETPQADGFWTEEELAQFRATDVAATATSEAFYDANTLPTPAPELVSEMEQKCNDAELVARSPLLQLWCADMYADD